MEYELTYEATVTIEAHSPEQAIAKLSSQLDDDIDMQDYDIISVEVIND